MTKMVWAGWARVRSINVRGELFSTVLTVFLLSTTKLASSLILTRLLTPEIYGIVAILASLLYIIEMASDLGVTGLIVRHERGDDPAFVRTLWTARLIRGLFNATLLFLLAPVFAELYGSPQLAPALRALSLIFVFMALESMSFPLAVRAQNSRIVSYVELGTNVAATIFTIACAYFIRDQWSVVYGMIFQRALTAVCSHWVNPGVAFGWKLEKSTLMELLKFSKHVMPTSLITMLLSQYERVVFLKLFDLTLLGLYGIAANIGGILVGMNIKLCFNVLYPRCAKAFRDNPNSLQRTFYSNNARLHAIILGIPAGVGGSAQLVVDALFDSRYLGAGFVLQALMVRASLQALQVSTEMSLTAAGHSVVQLRANIIRIMWLVPASYIGYLHFGFQGFILAACLDGVLAVVYVLWEASKHGLLSRRHEIMRFTYLIGLWGVVALLAGVLRSTPWWHSTFV